MKKTLEQFAAVILSLTLVLTGLTPAFAQEQDVFKVMDTTAGKPAFVQLTGLPNEVVELKFINPYHSVINQKFQLDESGLLQYWYPMAVMSGEYSIYYKGQSSNFVVMASEPDPRKSSISLDDYTAFAGETITGTIELKDRFENVITGRKLSVMTKGSAAINCSGNCVTDRRGQVQLSISSQKEGLKLLSVVDQTTNKEVFAEEIGFIPQVQRTIRRTQFNPYQMANQWDFAPQPEYVPVYNPYEATSYAQGNDDRGATFDYLAADLLQSSYQLLAQVDSELEENTPEQIVQNTEQQDFHILIGTDEDADFEEEVTVTANSALNFVIKAVDSLGNVKTDYTGEIAFDISPSGPLLPGDFEFSELDQGVSVFELALILPVGEYTLAVEDTLNPDLRGEIQVSSQLENIPQLNNTNIILNLDSPIANSKYAGTFSVQGSVNTDNTEIIVKEAGVELERVNVDEDLSFNFPLDLEDGTHKLEITALYLVDGSESTTMVDLEVDKTAPVIIQVDSDLPTVRAGENFEMKVQADADSILKAFINNRAYEFVGEGTSYTLNAKAPLDAGEYPINLQIADEFGNIETAQDVATLTVTAAMTEVANLFGIPGIGTITLSWQPVEGAANYEVSYKSILGTSSQTVETSEPRYTFENLAPNVSYVFTVTAKDESGVAVSKATDSRALKVLEAPARNQVPATTTETPQDDLKGAAEEVTTTPVRHTNSGPEVYLLILLSIFLLNGYGRLRKRLAL